MCCSQASNSNASTARYRQCPALSMVTIQEIQEITDQAPYRHSGGSRNSPESRQRIPAFERVSGYTAFPQVPPIGEAQYSSPERIGQVKTAAFAAKSPTKLSRFHPALSAWSRVSPVSHRRRALSAPDTRESEAGVRRGLGVTAFAHVILERHGKTHSDAFEAAVAGLPEVMDLFLGQRRRRLLAARRRPRLAGVFRTDDETRAAPARCRPHHHQHRPAEGQADPRAAARLPDPARPLAAADPLMWLLMRDDPA